MSTLAARLLANLMPQMNQTPPKMEVAEIKPDPFTSLVAAALGDSLSPIVVPTSNMAMPQLPPMGGMESLAPGLGGTLADGPMPQPQLADTLKTIGMDRGIPNRPTDLASEATLSASMPMLSQPDGELFPAARARSRATRPTPPKLRDLPEYDPDLRGQEKGALTSFLVGSLLGGPRAGLSAALGASQGHQQGRASLYSREAGRIAQGNKNAIDLFKEQNDMFGELSKLDNNLDLETMRQGGRDADRASRERTAQQQIEAAMKRTNATLRNDLIKFDASNEQKKQETSRNFLEWIYDNAGTMDDLSQGLLIQRYNVYAQEAGLPGMAVPGTPVLDASGNAVQNPDGTVARVPRIGLSPRGMNARTAAANAETNTVLAKSLVGDRLTKADLAERELAVQAGHLQNMDAIAAQREIRAADHQQWLRASKAVDQELARARNSIRGAAGTPTAQQAAAIQKELSLSGQAVEAIRAKAGQRPDSIDESANPGALARWEERRRAMEDTALAYREYLNAQAARIGYTFNGTTYVPGATQQALAAPLNPDGTYTPNLERIYAPSQQGQPTSPPTGPKMFGPKKKLVGQMSAQEIKSLPPGEYAEAVAELKRIMGGK